MGRAGADQGICENLVVFGGLEEIVDLEVRGRYATGSGNVVLEGYPIY